MNTSIAVLMLYVQNHTPNYEALDEIIPWDETIAWDIAMEILWELPPCCQTHFRTYAISHE